MEPFLSVELLDESNPYYQTKLDNLEVLRASFDERARVLNPTPARVTLQTTDGCNLRCRMCQLPRPSEPNHMPIGLFNRLVEKLFPTLVEIHPTNIGEPLVSPWFIEMCASLRKYGVLLDITTNGMLLSKKVIDTIIPLVKDVKISFDGVNKRTFESIRRGADLERVRKNTLNLVSAIEGSQRDPSPTVSLQMTLLRSNYLELPDVIRTAHELGVDRVKAYHIFSPSKELDNETIVHFLDDYERILQESLTIGDELNIELELAEPSLKSDDIGMESQACHLPWYESFIDTDGAVFICHSHGGENCGNMNDSGFNDIWNSELYQTVRKGFRVDSPCWSCKDCGMNFRKEDEHQEVPYDMANFLSEGQTTLVDRERRNIRWTGRSRQFDLTGRDCHDKRA